jgi:hypothetical protein
MDYQAGGGKSGSGMKTRLRVKKLLNTSWTTSKGTSYLNFSPPIANLFFRLSNPWRKRDPSGQGWQPVVTNLIDSSASHNWDWLKSRSGSHDGRTCTRAPL